MKTRIVFVFAAILFVLSAISAEAGALKKATLHARKSGGTTAVSGNPKDDGVILLNISSLPLDSLSAGFLVLTTTEGRDVRVAIGDVTGDGTTNASTGGMGAGKATFRDFSFIVNKTTGQVMRASSFAQAQIQARTSKDNIAVCVKKRREAIEIESWSL